MINTNDENIIQTSSLQQTSLFECLDNNDNNFSFNNSNNYMNIDDFIINIGTHNVRGFNVGTKRRLFFDAYYEYGLDIIGITETKILESQSKFIMTDNKYYKS